MFFPFFHFYCFGTVFNHKKQHGTNLYILVTLENLFNSLNKILSLQMRAYFIKCCYNGL